MHPEEPGARKKNAIGKSRGGKTTKIHARVDALGHLLALEVTCGQVHDSRKAIELLDGASAGAFIMDKAYDSNEIRSKVKSLNAVPVIPCRSNRRVQTHYDRALYKERFAVENFFQRIKRWRKVATRYAKNLLMYRAAVVFAAVIDWLR